jgi:glyoxylase-like metal-dependent hydrolase (beta-lactamase superfamily II)
MYELIQVSANNFYIQSPAKIGVVKVGDADVCLIDSGSDKDAGRRVRRVLDENGWRLVAIFNTHSNADHVGGNRYLQGQTGCKIYAPGIERDITEHPVLEPAFLYGGFPPKELRHKFLMAQASEVELLSDDVLPEGMSAIALPGHFFDMVGFRTADDVVYLADCLSSKETLEKYRVAFVYDVAAYLETLESVKEMEAALFVPSHADATADIAPLAQLNIDCVRETEARILEICKTPEIFEEVLRQLFVGYGLMMSFDQYVLVGSTVRSYLSWLRDRGVVDVFAEGGQLLWQTV